MIDDSRDRLKQLEVYVQSLSEQERRDLGIAAHQNERGIFDLVKKYLRQLDIRMSDMDFLPSDNLADSAWFPVYPEIGEHCGMGGSYSFKVPGRMKLLNLKEFVSSSFDIYRASEACELHPAFATLDRVQALAETLRA